MFDSKYSHVLIVFFFGFFRSPTEYHCHGDFSWYRLSTVGCELCIDITVVIIIIHCTCTSSYLIWSISATVIIWHTKERERERETGRGRETERERDREREREESEIDRKYSCQLCTCNPIALDIP